jgi:hypothetical protein
MQRIASNHPFSAVARPLALALSPYHRWSTLSYLQDGMSPDFEFVSFDSFNVFPSA